MIITFNKACLLDYAISSRRSFAPTFSFLLADTLICSRSMFSSDHTMVIALNKASIPELAISSIVYHIR